MASRGRNGSKLEMYFHQVVVVMLRKSSVVRCGAAECMIEKWPFAFEKSNVVN